MHPDSAAGYPSPKGPGGTLRDSCPVSESENGSPNDHNCLQGGNPGLVYLFSAGLGPTMRCRSESWTQARLGSCGDRGLCCAASIVLQHPAQVVQPPVPITKGLSLEARKNCVQAGFLGGVSKTMRDRPVRERFDPAQVPRLYHRTSDHACMACLASSL
ncbi:uncharacterized protein ColSpa_05299 [Colletotrichum spaethianum]|uniref:Uncharacterized protein n=1 Tax=Colletotrichum spaethianum TaxID=700344 RepID=A0AA37LB43_9PEZI|nr:uncharacterized protein ColSpa_05299 [Colletotrichum spaethianum]GKT45118.1 hypothetical protein ColSpa_05299 [Colletotrichum spaethianum]